MTEDRLKAPGAPARGSQSGRPIMVLFDVLGRRWTLRILWELRAERLSFRALRERCDAISPTVLNDRLKQLRALALVDLAEGGYALSEAGADLARRLIDLDEWATRWAEGVAADRDAP